MFVNNITKFLYKDIHFVESGAIVSVDEEKEVLNFLSPTIHIIGFDDSDKSIVAMCLEFGMAADGKNKQEALHKVLSLTKDFLSNNSKQVIEKILTSSNMDYYWALYRLYEKRHAPKNIKKPKQELKTPILMPTGENIQWAISK